MIPKIIHYCWFGGNPLPDDAQKCIASWKRYLPDYDIKEWNESNFDVNCCPYVKEAYEAKKYAFVSDYARFKVLYNEGGLYFDTDVEIIEDMTHIINAGNFMGFEKSLATRDSNCGAKLGVNPGIGFGIEAKLPFIREMLNFYEAKIHFVIEEGTVVDYTTDMFRKYGFQEEHKLQKIADITIYPADYFCPMDSTTGIIAKTENTVSIHHYSCSWLDQNSLSFRLHLLKNKLISIFGDKWIMKICNLLRQLKQ